MLPREFVQYQNKLYWVYRTVPKNSVKEGFLNDLKDLWNCEMVVKNKQNDTEKLFFLREIPEAELAVD